MYTVQLSENARALYSATIDDPLMHLAGYFARILDRLIQQASLAHTQGLAESLDRGKLGSVRNFEARRAYSLSLSAPLLIGLSRLHLQTLQNSSCELGGLDPKSPGEPPCSVIRECVATTTTAKQPSLSIPDRFPADNGTLSIEFFHLCDFDPAPIQGLFV